MPLFNKNISNFKLGNYLNSSNVAYIIFSSDYIPLFWSPAAERLLPEYLIKNTKVQIYDYLKKVLSEEEYIRLSIFMKNNPKTATFEAKFDKPSSLSSKTTLKCSFTRQNDGTFFVTIDDITKQKLKEQFLIIA